MNIIFNCKPDKTNTINKLNYSSIISNNDIIVFVLELRRIEDLDYIIHYLENWVKNLMAKKKFIDKTEKFCIKKVMSQCIVVLLYFLVKVGLAIFW